MYVCVACVYKGIAHVYSTALYKNLIDDGIAFTYILLLYRLYQLNVCGTINRKLMPEITYSTYQYKVHYYNTHILLHVLSAYGSAPDMVYVASSWQDLSAYRPKEKICSNLVKKGSKMRFVQKN